MGWEMDYSWGMLLRGEAASHPPTAAVSQRAGSVWVCCARSSQRGRDSGAGPGMLTHSHYRTLFNSIQFND